MRAVDFQILKYSNTQILKSSNTQILKSSNLQILKSSNPQILKSSSIHFPNHRRTVVTGRNQAIRQPQQAIDRINMTAVTQRIHHF